MKLIQDLEIKPGARVLLRCDLNLPQDDSGNFTDFFRLESSLPTIEYLQSLDTTIFILAHLGSPKGKPDSELSLQSLSPILADQIGVKVNFIDDPFDDSQDLTSQKGVFLVENVRFWPGEEEASLSFAQDLVRVTGSEFFIQDAFGVVHRNHASITILPEVIPSAAGLLLQKEISSLTTDEDDLALIVGGAKVESKLPVISNFIDKASSVLTGGMVANTFLKAAGEDISASLFEASCLDLAEEIAANTEGTKTELVLPVDYVTSASTDSLDAQEFDRTNLQPGQLILDLGQSTVRGYSTKLKEARMAIWAGTLGFAENPVFAGASKEVLAQLLQLKSSNPEFKIIIGGGDTVDFVRDSLGSEELAQIDHLSTGGGASLLMLSGEKLPGIQALDKTPSNSLVANSQASSRQVTAVSSELGSKTPIIIANLKSNFNSDESKTWLDEVLQSDVLTSPTLNFSLAPSSIFIEEMSSNIGSAKLKNPPEVLAQDVSSEDEGPNTGVIAASQLKGIASGTIIGHSERRADGDSNQDVYQKILRATDSKLKVILCVGGKSQDSNSQKKEVYEQLRSALLNINSQQAALITVAYEPVFSIGTGIVPSIDFLQEQLGSIREVLDDNSIQSKVLYGGSVTTDNAKEIIEAGFEGLLVGSASLKPKSLEQIGISISA